MDTAASTAPESAGDGPKRRWMLPKTSRPFQLLIFTLVAAIVLPLIGVDLYTGEVVWPLVIGGYSGAALAFLSALAWDRHSRLQEEARASEAERRRTEERLKDEQERRVVEAKRRFGAIELELERLKASIERAKREQHNYKHFFPDLPTGSWVAASGPLGNIVSNYGLMADLATFYGHVEELRWRLRFKADPATDENLVNPMIDNFVGQMSLGVDDLLEQVREQIQAPDVEQIVGAPKQAEPRVVRRRQFTGAIRVQSPEEIAKALAAQGLPGLENPGPGSISIENLPPVPGESEKQSG